MSPSVRTPDASSMPRPRNATAVESSSSSDADAHSATMPTNAARTIFSSRLSGPSAASARRAAAGASGVAVDFGRDQPVQQQRHQRHADQRRHRRGEQPRAEPDLDAEGSRDLGAERVRGHRRQPERRRQAEADDAGEHQEAADASAAVLVARCRAAGFGEREGERIDDAGARGIARKGRRDQAVDQEDAVGQARASNGRRC